MTGTMELGAGGSLAPGSWSPPEREASARGTAEDRFAPRADDRVARHEPPEHDDLLVKRARVAEREFVHRGLAIIAPRYRGDKRAVWQRAVDRQAKVDEIAARCKVDRSEHRFRRRPPRGRRIDVDTNLPDPLCENRYRCLPAVSRAARARNGDYDHESPADSRHSLTPVRCPSPNRDFPNTRRDLDQRSPGPITNSHAR